MNGAAISLSKKDNRGEQGSSRYFCDQCLLIGYDLIEENIAFLKEGIIDFLISQRPEVQGYQGIYALYRHVVLNERIQDKIMMQLDVVTKENIDYYQCYEKNEA